MLSGDSLINSTCLIWIVQFSLERWNIKTLPEIWDKMATVLAHHIKKWHLKYFRKCIDKKDIFENILFQKQWVPCAHFEMCLKWSSRVIDKEKRCKIQRLPSSRCLRSSCKFEVHFPIYYFKISLDIILIIQKYGEIPTDNWLCTVRDVLHEVCFSRTARK